MTVERRVVEQERGGLVQKCAGIASLLWKAITAKGGADLTGRFAGRHRSVWQPGEKIRYLIYYPIAQPAKVLWTHFEWGCSTAIAGFRLWCRHGLLTLERELDPGMD